MACPAETFAFPGFIRWIEHVLFHGNYCMKYLKAGFIFALFGEAGRTLANGKGIWSILTDKETPGRAAVLAEKERAVTLADQGLALLKRLDPPSGDHRWRLWNNATVITWAVRELIRCIAAYFDDMEQGEAGVHLKAQVAASLAEFDRLAGHRIEIVQREFVNGLEHRMKELNRTIEELVLEPLAAI